MSRGFVAIGLVRPKDGENIGGVLRAGYVYGAALVCIEGIRTSIRHKTDTTKAWRHMPVLRGDELFALAPYDTIPVAVDLIDGAQGLPDFVHPQRAFYIFGLEDGTLGEAHVSQCKHVVSVPTRHCMNLAATVNVVLYDRLAKQNRSAQT